MKRVYKIKKTISLRQFVLEFGNDFSKHMKQRLLELGLRCVLTRKEESSRLDIKHVEHIRYDSGIGSEDGQSANKKEYSYGQFIMNEGNMYFSGRCAENEEVMQAPAVDTIYYALDSELLLLDGGIEAKKIDDGNIDYVIDSILEVCPEMSPEHRAIISRY